MIYLYIFLSLLLSAFFSGMEIAYLSSDKLRYELDRNRGGVTGRILGVFYAHPNHYITTLLVGNNIALVVYGLLMAKVMEDPLRYFLPNDGLILLVQSLLSTILILFAGEFIPKVTFKLNANRVMMIFAVPLFLMYIILFPFAYFCTLLSSLFLIIVGQKSKPNLSPALSTIDLEHYLSHSMTAEGSDGELDTEVKIIQNAIEFPSLQVRDCMIPRNEMVGVDLNADLSMLESRFVSTGLSKIIVYKDNIDDVVGYIHSSEMFKGEDWQKRIVPAVFVPESMYASKLMKQLMQKKRSIAVVIDELGGTAGMITLEDVVEEIFGDIEDEHDKNKLVAKKLDDNVFIFSGRMEIDDINDRFGLDLPEDEDFMTIAGFILYHYQSIPNPGEILNIENYSFEILRSSSTKIDLVKMTIISE